MKTNTDLLRSMFFFSLVAIVSILAFTVFSRYLNLLIVTFVIVYVFSPLYRFFIDKLKNKGVATALSVVSVLLFVIIPLVIILVLVVNEIQAIAALNQSTADIGRIEEILNNLITKVNEILSQSDISLTISSVNLREILNNLDKTALVRDQLFPIVGGIASLSGEIIVTLFLMILALLYMFPSFDKIPNAMAKISPLDNDVDLLLLRRFKETIKGVVKGTLVVSILQATAVIIPLVLLQVGAPALLWVLMVVLSIVPIGSGLVWAPISLILVINGVSSGEPLTILSGVGLFIYSAIIINVIDTTVRPRLMRNTVNLNPLVTIFSVLGGIAVFGFMGILYGPLIIVLFLTVMEVYAEKYQGKNSDLL